MKTSCSLCAGRGRSDCPALGAPICGPCCGTKRNRAIKCTTDCRFDPFSPMNYDAWLRIDSALSRKMLDYLSKYYSEEDFNKVARKMMYDESQHAYAMGCAAAAYYLYFSKPFKNGKTVADLWREEGWSGLNGDEIFMMECRKTAGPALIEIQKIVDHQAMECVDLLKPERGIFIMLDRSAASHIARFTRLWLWLADYPYFSRPGGDPLSVPERMERVLLDKILSDLIKERSRANGVAREQMIAKNFGKYARFICEESHKSRQRMLSKMDFHECRAFYEIKGSRDEVKTVLDSRPDFMLVEDANEKDAPWPAITYDWLRRGESKAIEEKMMSVHRHDEDDEAVGLLGRVYLGEKEMMVQAMFRLKFGFAKDMVRKYWGNLLEFRRESIVDLAQQMADRADKDEPLVPEELEDKARETSMPKEVEEQFVTDHYRKHYQKFLEDKIPALDGMTPRKAAKSAKMRPRLIELMKGHIHNIDTLNKDRGFFVSIVWVLEELGLKELL